MSTAARPPVWKMLREGIQALGGATTNVALRDWVLQHYPGTNPLTIQAQTVVCTVNHASRIHYPEGHKPRAADGQQDFLYRSERGHLELYDPAKHGRWEIFEQENGRLGVRRTDWSEEGPTTQEPELLPADETPTSTAFAAEAHLRDYLTGNLRALEPGLELFVDENGITGTEYRTPIGIIDILAVDKDGGFVVIELKVSKGPDAVAGQVLRYKNWIARHLAEGRKVRGIIVAQHISEKVLYSLLSDPDISVREYELELRIKNPPALP